MSKATKGKYYNFMMACYDAKEFNVREMREEHKVSTRLITLMRENQLIKSDGDVTRWIGNMPTQALANAFTKECLKQSRTDNALSKAGTAQLSIRPLKRVASVIEPPVQPIEADNESQLTWIHLLLIFAAGILAGGLIATIWK